MRSVFLRKVVGIAVGLALLSACAGSGSGAPAPGVAPQADGFAGNGEAGASNLSGQYKGTFSENERLREATLDVAQYHAAIGGKLTLQFARFSKAEDAVWTLSGSKLAGTIIIAAGGWCVLATTATYDPTTHVLIGKFSPTPGCSGLTNGGYNLRHKCVYKPARSQDVRPDAGGLRMC
ncbi:MAG TPA: hypothetical protein VMT95_08655 [Candidatus Binatia bacterium]|nr:hypothetical protein [Candidatus Binatia bacterium]